MYSNNITDKNLCQEAPLRDCYISAKDGKMKQRPWRKHKEENMVLANIYELFDRAKAKRLRECGIMLQFKEYANGDKRIHKMSSCRVRLCPLCQWRRSLKNFYNNFAVAEWVNQKYGGEWLSITLTMKSCYASEVSAELDKLLYAFKKFMLITEVKNTINGFYRGLEVTHDNNLFITAEDFKKRNKYLKNQGLKPGDFNPTYDMYHPHIHLLAHVQTTYFSKAYISLEGWAELWKQALDVDYLPSVSVKRVKKVDEIFTQDDNRANITPTTTAGAVAEVSKYMTKPTDYIYPDDIELSANTVKTLDEAFKNRRLIAYGGVCLEAKRELRLQEAEFEEADLINVGDGEPERTDEYKIVSYFWNTGLREYYTSAPGTK